MSQSGWISGRLNMGMMVMTLVVTAPAGVLQQCQTDTDLDGDEWSVEDGDCDDANADIYPGATEVCDGIDQNCDGQIDGGASCGGCVGVVDGSNAPYLLCNESMAWADASGSCAGYGYHLVRIDTSEESSWVTSAVASYLSGQLTWIGLNDISSEGSFVWEDGSSPAYTSWSSGEPNNSHGGECSSESEEDCTVTNWGSGGTWNDFHCGCYQPYVCELY